MNVELIHYTGANTPDPARTAAELLVYTKNTRLEQGEQSRQKVGRMTSEDLSKELAYIANTIRSSWEFIDYTFEITGVTRAFTHQFVRTRTASYAQQSQRSVVMKDLQVLVPGTIKGADRELAWNKAVTAMKSGYARLIELGVPAQDARGLLPTNVLTNVVAKMNLRTVADLVGKRVNLRAQGEYTDVVVKMSDSVLAVHPWAKAFLFPQRKATPELDRLLAEALGQHSPIDKPKLNAALKELDALKATWG